MTVADSMFIGFFIAGCSFVVFGIIKNRLDNKKKSFDDEVGVPWNNKEAYIHCICNYVEQNLGINRIHNPNCPVHKLRIAKIK